MLKSMPGPGISLSYPAIGLVRDPQRFALGLMKSVHFEWIYRSRSVISYVFTPTKLVL